MHDPGIESTPLPAPVDDTVNHKAPVAHYPNVDATLVIEGYGARIAIEVTDENRQLCHVIERAFNGKHHH